MLSSLLRVAAISALATPLMAQWLPYGNVIMDGSQNLVTADLGFSFTMPGGNVVTSVDVDETGRIIEVGTDPTDSSESTAEMLAIPGGQIMVLWDLPSYTADPNASVFFYTDNATVAAVTWYNVSWAGVTTCQAQLYASGEIHMLYDSRNPEDDGHIGLCPGNGAIAPAASDLSTAIGGSITTTDPTIFEDFDFTAGVNEVDFTSAQFIYVPNGAGGINGWTVVGTGGIPDPGPAPFAVNEDLGSAGCPIAQDPSVSYTFVPNGGNYDIASSPGAFDPNIGPSLGLASDDGKSTDFDLGFAFPWPSGADNLIDIDPNGRILPSNSTDAGDWSATPEEHDDAEAIAVFWSDMNVLEPGSGNVHMSTVPGVSATITWNNVKQYDSTDATPVPGGLTFQVTLFPSGVFLITHEDIGLFNHPAVETVGRDLLIGFSDGSGVDPGEIDLTALPVNVPIGVNYEFWDSSFTTTTPAVEPTDLIAYTYLPDYIGTLVPLSTPTIGTNWDLEIQSSAAALFGFYMIGFTSASVDLTFFGSPCNLLVNQVELVTTFSNGAGGMLPWSLPLPNDPLLIGAELVVQGAIEAAPQPPFAGFAGLPWAFSFTNAILGRIGNL